MITPVPVAHPAITIVAYKGRWTVLIVFLLYSSLSLLQWVEYAILNDSIMKYYNVSAKAVNWTSMVFMVVWPIFVVPVTYVMDKTGLRMSGLIGAFGSSAGAVLKMFSSSPDRFVVVMIGQTVVGVSQLFIMSLPPMLAVHWFKEQEIATVCALSYFGMNFGIASGFLIPPLLVRDVEDIEQIGLNLFILNLIVAGISLAAALAVLVYFPKEPPNAPNLARHHAHARAPTTPRLYLKSIVKLLKNRAFMIHALAFGINVGIFYAFGTLANLIILNYFENAQEDAGCMGMLMIVGGMVGSVVIGFILDKTHEFKATIVVIYFTCGVSLAVLLLTLELRSKALSYVAISVFGFFMGAYIPCGVEVGTELTFPSSESTVAGMTFAIAQSLGLIFTLSLHEINEKWGTIYGVLTQIVLLVLGGVLTCFTPPEQPRQSMYRESYAAARQLTTTMAAAAVKQAMAELEQMKDNQESVSSSDKS